MKRIKKLLKRILYAFFIIKILWYYRIFNSMRDLNLNHIAEKDSDEYAKYLEVVYLFKIKNLLKKQADDFFYNHKNN